MEESEKRKERLMAMRMEASQAGAGADSNSSGLSPNRLSNPLIESSSPAPTHCAPRFDFYTDPMAAYSGNRRNNSNPPVLQGHYNTPQRPVYQVISPPAPVYHSPGGDSPGPRIFQAPMTHFNRTPVGSQMQAVAPPFRPQQGNPPSSWGGPRGAFNYNNPPSNLSNPGNPPYGNYGQGNPPYINYGQGNPPCVNYGQGNPPYASYGQGRGQRFNSGRSRGSPGNGQSPRSGFGGRRGSGSHEPVSAEQRPYMYYRKEMVEDPWEMLTPVVWKDTQARDSDKSWLPKSISMKKAKVSGEASVSSISQQSLAEYLAASFKDSTDETVDDERGDRRTVKCWLKKQNDVLAPDKQDTGNKIMWTSGTVFGRGEGIVGLETEYGTLHIKLLPECSPHSVAYILDLLSLRHCAGCHFYRAEGRGQSWDTKGNHIKDEHLKPKFGLIQGTLETQGQLFTKIESEYCPTIRRGSVAWVRSGPDFFISLANHEEWRNSYTVWGLEDMGIAEKIGELPTKSDVWSNINVSVLESSVPLKIQRINIGHTDLSLNAE